MWHTIAHFKYRTDYKKIKNEKKTNIHVSTLKYDYMLPVLVNLEGNPTVNLPVQ